MTSLVIRYTCNVLAWPIAHDRDGMSEACVQLVQTAPGLVDSAMFVVKLLDFMEETFRYQ